MSVTFRPELLDGDERGWGFWCYPTDETHVFGTRADAEIGAKQHAAVCEDCRMYRIHATVVYREMPEVNMANRNAAFVLELLGLPFEDGCGMSDVATFAERIAFATVVGGNDQGSETVVYKEDGGAKVIDVGRHAGYVDERLEQLSEVVAWAKAHGRRIVWA